jgi:hypothetical protein
MMAEKKHSFHDKMEQAIAYVMEHPVRVLVGGVVLGVGGWSLYKVGKGLADDAKRKRAEQELDSSPEARQASVLRSAMNPSGISWMRNMDTTDSSRILETAKTITNLDAVITSYRKLYSADLIEDLQSELSSEDYQKFMNLVSSNTGKGGKPAETYAKKSQMVVAKKDVNVRKTPDASYNGAWYEGSSGDNILFNAKAGEFIGYATGNQEFDSKNNVKFIQVGYIVKKDGLPANLKPFAGKSYSMWVSSSNSYIDIYDNFNTMFSQYPKTQPVVAYKKPLNYYSGVLKGLSGKLLVTATGTAILNEKMQPFVKVEAGVLLGEYLQSLQARSVVWYQFRTVDKTLRWVNANHVKMYII